jgi:hypothetical protein
MLRSAVALQPVVVRRKQSAQSHVLTIANQDAPVVLLKDAANRARSVAWPRIGAALAVRAAANLR